MYDDLGVHFANGLPGLLQVSGNFPISVSTSCSSPKGEPGHRWALPPAIRTARQ
jgi:hypothetical protein